MNDTKDPLLYVTQAADNPYIQRPKSRKRCVCF